MAKFNLEDAASLVYEKAETIYKGSEINADTLASVVDTYFSKKYSPRQLQKIKDYFAEQEQMFAELVDIDEKLEEATKTENDLKVGDKLYYTGDAANGESTYEITNIKDGKVEIKAGDNVKTISIQQIGNAGNNLYRFWLYDEYKKWHNDMLEKLYGKKVESEQLNIKGLNSNAKDLADEFDNYKSFVANFGKLIIVKTNGDFYVYKPSAKNYDEYIYTASKKDNIEGWLDGAVKANNGVFKDLSQKSEKVEESKEDDFANIEKFLQEVDKFSSNEAKEVANKLLDRFYILARKYEDKPTLTESKVTKYIIALSKRDVRYLITHGEEYDAYVKETFDNSKIIGDPELQYSWTEDSLHAKKYNDKHEANLIAGTIKEQGDWASVVVKPIEIIEESANIVYETSQSIANEIKKCLDEKLSGNVSTKVVSIDGTSGILITRKNNEDLVALSDVIVKKLKDIGVKKNQYEMEFKGNNLLIALDKLQLNLN